LEAVLEDAAHHDVDEVWNLGDMLGYAPFPNEVVRALRAAAVANIIGNYDLKVLDFKRKQSKWKQKKAPAKFVGFQWNDAQLLEENRAFLEVLPEQLRRKAGGLDALLVHGSPAAVDELLGADTPSRRLEELAELAQADIVACGHSHEPFVRRIGETSFINPGSVGRPEGGDWRASYALVRMTNGALKVGHRRVPYDLARVVRGVHAAALPKDYADVFRQARSLDQLWAAGRSGGPRSGKVPEAVMALARRCQYERDHSHQVTKLALGLFDGLTGLHGMGAKERLWLECGALLHDIGWLEGQQGHHKTSLRLIVSDPELPFQRREREIIGLIARYHRKALPRDGHKYYANLNAADRHRVRVLGGLLRVGDGLDRSHGNVVQRTRCAFSEKEIRIACVARGNAGAEVAAAAKKANLIEDVFGRPVRITVETGAE
jgi:putative phosphoesterase